jgi:hypothetical protein
MRYKAAGKPLTFFALVERINALKVKRPRLRYWRII